MRLAVIGAAGFVGRELLRELESGGVRVTAVVRGNAEISVGPTSHDVCSEPKLLPTRSFDAVVNLAYPTSGPTSRHPAQTAAIFETIASLLKDGGHLVHASTLAVFGPALDRPVKLGPVERSRDTSYVEAKIAAEHLAARHQKGRSWSVDIVRLGNVVGYGSPTWGVPLVQRLVTGRPVGVTGLLGYSNATDVANVVSYIRLLLDAPVLEPGVRYHHLAEFSHAPWRDWINPLADALRVEPVFASQSVLQTPTVRDELAAVVQTLKPHDIHRMFAAERVLGSWTRTLLRGVPGRAVEHAKGPDLVFARMPTIPRDEQIVLGIMSAQQEFKSAVRAEWSPPATKAHSVATSLAWLRRAFDVNYSPSLYAAATPTIRMKIDH